jgi:hypothetical protein
MSHDPEKYLYFNVGLLKDSFALEALWQDALKYHMIDQPGKLIALRLTEYYELMKHGSLPLASLSVASATMQPINANGASKEVSTPGKTSVSISVASEPDAAQKDDDHLPGDESVLLVSPEVEQNAEDAADYWALL